jgi:hypothetical protein
MRLRFLDQFSIGAIGIAMVFVAIFTAGMLLGMLVCVG